MMVGMVLLMTACSWPGSSADDDKHKQSRRVYISGGSEHVSDETIARIAKPYLRASFFSMDTQGLKEELADNPWLVKVRVSRHWPDGVVIHVEDRVPLALWRGEYVMDDHGEVFKPEKLPKGLVKLTGPEDDRDEIYKQYRRLSAILAGKEAHLAALNRDEHGNWLAWLDNGLELRLGRQHIGERMQRFVDYALTNSRARRALSEAGYVDLRYKDGFAVGGERKDSPTAKNEESVG